MKIRLKSVISLFIFLTITAAFIGMLSTSTAQAEAYFQPLHSNSSFVWAKSMGGANFENGNKIVLDTSENVYSAGIFNSTADFDPGAGTYNLSSAGSQDIFISKLDNNGNFIWAKSLGGTNKDTLGDMIIDSNGNVYTIGIFIGTADFDPGVAVYNLTSFGTIDIFISKLDSNGNFVWAKNIGGTGPTLAYGSSIVADHGGNIYLTGSFSDTTDFDPGIAQFNMTSSGFSDIFIANLDSNGNFIWAKQIGSTNSDSGLSIKIDSDNNIYTTGQYKGVVDFDPGTGVFNLSGSLSRWNTYISKLDGLGNFIWAKSISNETGDASSDMIALDTNNHIYTTGSFFGTIDFDPGTATFNLSSIDGNGIFISKLDTNGNFIWAKGMSGTATGILISSGAFIALDSFDNVYTTGSFLGTVDFDPGVSTFNLTSNTSGQSQFISKLSSNGNFVWANAIKGSGVVTGFSIVADKNNNIYTTGLFDKTADFDPGQGIFNLTSAGAHDIFISKIVDSPTFTDVPFDHPLHDYIEALYQAGYTAGCSTSPLMYCPDTILDRAQSAVFMLRGQMGAGYTPPPAPWDTFADDWTGFEWAQPWAEGMWQEGLTAGCQTSPLMYCPATQLPRVEASVFGLRMKYGVNYTPPAGTGTIFADMTDTSYWGIGWAEQAYLDGLLPACGTDSGTGKPLFCSSELVDRAWGAHLIVKAKNIPLP